MSPEDLNVSVFSTYLHYRILYKKFKVFRQNLYNLSKNEEKYHLKLHDWRLPSQIVIIELQSASVFGGRTRDKQ